MSRWTQAREWRTRLRGGLVLASTLVVAIATTVVAATAWALERLGADGTTTATALIAACVAMTFAAGYTIDRILFRFFAPLRALRRAMWRVAENQPNVRVDESGTHDLRSLARRFNRMAAQLERKRAVDEKLTSELERSAAQRATEIEQANEQLRTLDHAKDALLSNVSHEMRTPLTSIIAATEIVRGFTDDSPEARHEFLEIIDRESHRLLGIIESILELAQIEAREIELECVDLDLREVVDDALRTSYQTAREGDIAVHTSPPDAPITVHGDRRRLTELTCRLIDNAIKFSAAGQRVDVDLSIEAGEAVMRVLDEGPGIPAEQRATLFARFGQRGEVLTEKPHGVGVGLAICAGIADAHGGSMHYEARDWRGSRLVLRLPLAVSVLRKNLSHRARLESR